MREVNESLAEYDLFTLFSFEALVDVGRSSWASWAEKTFCKLSPRSTRASLADDYFCIARTDSPARRRRHTVYRCRFTFLSAACSNALNNGLLRKKSIDQREPTAARRHAADINKILSIQVKRVLRHSFLSSADNPTNNAKLTTDFERIRQPLIPANEAIWERLICTGNALVLFRYRATGSSPRSKEMFDGLVPADYCHFFLFIRQNQNSTRVE